MFPPEVYKSWLTPFRFLQRSASVFRQKTAIIHGDRAISYPEFAARANRLASALRLVGIERGDRVAALLPNIPHMLEAHFGVPLAGGILVAINTRLTSDEIAYILDHSGAKALIVDTELAELIAPVRDQLGSLETLISVDDLGIGSPVAGIDYERFLESGHPVPLDWPIEDEDDVITIDYTSGTTGRPKGVMYTHRGAY